jgi:hypothetical protein
MKAKGKVNSVNKPNNVKVEKGAFDAALAKMIASKPVTQRELRSTLKKRRKS